MGVILGSKARENVWKSSADWLAERSSAESVALVAKVPRKVKAAATGGKSKAPTSQPAPLRKAAVLAKPAKPKAASKPVAEVVPAKAAAAIKPKSPARTRKTPANVLQQ